MRASGVLQKCLGRSLGAMHEARSRVLLRSVEGLLAGWRLTLMDVARAWPGAERVRAPLKAFDRLLSNRHLHQEREQIYGDMARWLLRGERPVIVIDWSDLKADKAWCLLHWLPLQAGSPDWPVKRSTSRTGFHPDDQRASSTPSFASDAKCWSDPGPSNRYLDGWID